MRLSDAIEDFIKALMQSEEQQECELKRNELAEYFHCAPSQINYVLTTRFSMDKGYRIESQRGGGGSIKIIKMNLTSDDFYTALLQETGDSITVLKAGQMIDLLLEKELISEREDRLMKAAVSDRAIAGPVNLRNKMRAGILKNMILSVCGME